MVLMASFPDGTNEDSDEPAYETIVKKDVTVDEAINDVGIGRAQYCMLVICGLSFCADAAEVTFLSFVTEVLKCEWSLTELQETYITSAVFAGQVFGAPSWGFFADHAGLGQPFWGHLD